MPVLEVKNLKNMEYTLEIGEKEFRKDRGFERRRLLS